MEYGLVTKISKWWKFFLSLPRKIWLFFRLIGAVIRLIIKPNDVSPIFRIGEFRDHKSFKCCLNKAKSDPETAKLFEERYLAKEPYNIEKLITLPENSLGYIFAKHMNHYKLDVVFYPTNDLKNVDKDEINWFRQRARETHDVWHAFLGLPPDHLGEMKVSAFYLAQLNSPLSAGILGAGVFYSVIKKPHILPVLFDSISEYWKKGKDAKPLMGIRWEELWNKPIHELRAQYNIEVDKEAYELPSYKELEKEQKEYFYKTLEPSEKGFTQG